MLAADKLAANFGLARTVTKIWRHGDALLGLSGDAGVGTDLREWFKAGAVPDRFPEQAREEKATLIVIDARRVLSAYVDSPFPLVFEDEQFAIGSGRDYALAAMHLGCDARKAVEVACHFEISCGGGIDVIVP